MRTEIQPLFSNNDNRYYFPDHPGIDPLSLMYAPAESFEGFQPFVNTRGLNSTTERVFKQLLPILFKRTGSLWMPGYCTSAVEIAKQARDFVRQIPTANVVVMLNPNKDSLHTWTRLEISDQPLVALDPAGVPSNEGRILPYFGPVSPCVLNRARLESAEQVYINSISLSPVEEVKLVAMNRKGFTK